MKKVFASRLTSGSTEDSFPILDLPEQLIEHVLSFVCTEDLLKNCRLVNGLFQRIVDTNGFWKLKCERDGKTIPNFHPSSLPANYYKAIYMNNPYGRNLLRNGHGDVKKESDNGASQLTLKDSASGDGDVEVLAQAVQPAPYSTGDNRFAYWQVTHDGGDGWCVEAIPLGTDALPLANQSCFATSFEDCVKEQIISLVKEGVAPEVLDTVKPAIEVSEWYAARFDCGSIYRLVVELLDDAKKPVATFDTENIVTQQQVGRQWKQVCHTFENYPEGVRYIRFKHFGRDTQFWAGYYGAKMAGGIVRIPPEQTNMHSTVASVDQETGDKTSETQ